MLRLLGDVTGHRILDAGCGSGPTSIALTERGADVSGFDLSAAMIDIARRRLPGTECTEDYDFAGVSVDLTFFHRPLSAMAESFAGSGFRIAGIHEPPADPDTPEEVLPPGLQRGEKFMGFLFFDLEAL